MSSMHCLAKGAVGKRPQHQPHSEISIESSSSAMSKKRRRSFEDGSSCSRKSQHYQKTGEEVESPQQRLQQTHTLSQRELPNEKSGLVHKSIHSYSKAVERFRHNVGRNPCFSKPIMCTDSPATTTATTPQKNHNTDRRNSLSPNWTEQTSSKHSPIAWQSEPTKGQTGKCTISDNNSYPYISSSDCWEYHSLSSTSKQPTRLTLKRVVDTLVCEDVVKRRVNMNQVATSCSVHTVEIADSTTSRTSTNEGLTQSQLPSLPLPTNVVVLTPTTARQEAHSVSSKKQLSITDRIPRKKKAANHNDTTETNSIAITHSVKNELPVLSKKDTDTDRDLTINDSDDNDYNNIPDCKDVSRVALGSRVAVYWDGEDEYFAGTIVRHSPNRRKRYYIKYDDGDMEWMNFEGERFRLLPPKKKYKDHTTTKKNHDKSIEEVVERVKVSEKQITTKSIQSVERRDVDTELSKSSISVLSNERKSQDDVYMPKIMSAVLTKEEKLVSELENEVVEQLQALEKHIQTKTIQTLARQDVAPELSKSSISILSNEGKTQNDISKPKTMSTVVTNKEDSKEEKFVSGFLNHRDDTNQSCTKGIVTENKVQEDVVGQFDWVAAGAMKNNDSSDDSETDEEELVNWAVKMFGIQRPALARKKKVNKDRPTVTNPDPISINHFDWEEEWAAAYEAAGVSMRISEKVKLARRKCSAGIATSATATTPACTTSPNEIVKNATNKKLRITMQRKSQDKMKLMDTWSEEEAQRRKAQDRPPTAAEIRTILGEECYEQMSSSWVRRSVRQPSKSALTSPCVKSLLEKLQCNDSDMVVLKMKKYCSDLGTPCIVIDAVLDALEENRNCEALYIQNFNEGMRDLQVLHLLKILQQPSCKIWCLNIGENYKVTMETWDKFANGLKFTKITHMYASEHTITPELKELIRVTIRDNRKKHNMHCNPDNLDTIIQCTHCWWNPINTKSLRPFLRLRGFEHILKDAEKQGLAGTISGADLR